GAPLSITAPISTIYNSTTNMTPDIVGNFPKSLGKVTKVSNGVYYFTGFHQVVDPYKSNVTTVDSLDAQFGNLALADASGNLILVNPKPGKVGTLARNWLEGPRSVNFDVDLIKRVQIGENKQFEFRLDAINVMNHTNFGSPALNINSPND